MADEAMVTKMMEIAGYGDITFKRVDAPVLILDETKGLFTWDGIVAGGNIISGVEVTEHSPADMSVDLAAGSVNYWGTTTAVLATNQRASAGRAGAARCFPFLSRVIPRPRPVSGGQGVLARPTRGRAVLERSVHLPAEPARAVRPPAGRSRSSPG